MLFYRMHKTLHSILTFQYLHLTRVLQGFAIEDSIAEKKKKSFKEFVYMYTLVVYLVAINTCKIVPGLHSVFNTDNSTTLISAQLLHKCIPGTAQYQIAYISSTSRCLCNVLIKRKLPMAKRLPSVRSIPSPGRKASSEYV